MSTPQQSWPPLPEANTATWLNRAVQATASLEAEGVVFTSNLDDEGWDRLPTVDRDSIRLHPTHQPHAHSVHELCLATGGTAAMLLKDQAYRLDAPKLLVLEAGITHGEGRLADHPYDLMWIGLHAQGLAYAGFSSYRPDTGWRSRFRQPLTGRARRLLSRFARQHDTTPAGWPMLQNELLDTLVALQAAALDVDAPASSQQPAGWATSVVADVQKYLLSHLAEPLRLDDVAHLVRLSPNYINLMFRRETGTTIHAWILEQRLKKAMEMCRHTSAPFKDVAAAVGFNDPLYFSKAFRRRFGLAPTEARASEQTV